ncbi:MAG TPA: PTS sugar transporter subunit IIA [Verrucomicrobiales bacterium]|nr:PTS sugar transporter subunit IIA [Verrucomicrobiales bacterium]
MNLANLLTERHIVADMHSTEHWPAIVELVDHLSRETLLPAADRRIILEALRLREIQSSTGIGNGVAIPHAFSSSLSRVLTVFGRSLRGIDFDAIDGAPVRFVVLFVVPENQYHIHLRTLASIAKMFTNSEILRQLAGATGAGEILDILQARPARA